MIEIKDPEQFFAIQSKFERVPFTQSRAWCSYLISKGKRIVFFVNDENDPKIAFFGQQHNIPVIGGKILRIEGECHKLSLSEKVFTNFYNKLTDLHFSGFEINSNTPYNINFEIGIRRAGFIRPIALTACPLTIEIDLINDFNFNRTWSRNLKKAQQNHLSFREIHQIDDATIENIVAMFREMAELKKLGYLLEKESLRALVISKDIRTFMVCDEQDRPLAARIIHSHNKYQTDVFAANSLAARDCGATYFLMDSILKMLKNEGNEFFDFGRIPPSNHATDSIYNFKNSTRGRKIQYNGEWVFYKKKWVEYLMFIYKQFVIKKQRY